jgi:hypothetical protein
LLYRIGNDYYFIILEDLNMSEKTNKIKEFVERNKPYLIGGAIAIGGILIGRSFYKKAFMDGAVVGFSNTIEWCDRTFKDLNLAKRMDEYMELNPDKFTTRRIGF